MPAGRPPFYNTVDEMQKIIDEYFDSRKAPLIDKKGLPLLDKDNMPIMVDTKPCTVTGLALALGFTSRQALLNYQDKEEFVDAITRAKFRCQEYAETRLYDKDGANGAKFSLQNNFSWVDKQEVAATNLNINEDVSNLTDAEIENKLAQYGYKKA